jgi:hypothetical protein
MRSPRRAPRRLRPRADVLESLAHVSSLLPGVWPAAAPPVSAPLVIQERDAAPQWRRFPMPSRIATTPLPIANFLPAPAKAAVSRTGPADPPPPATSAKASQVAALVAITSGSIAAEAPSAPSAMAVSPGARQPGRSNGAAPTPGSTGSPVVSPPAQPGPSAATAVRAATPAGQSFSAAGQLNGSAATPLSGIIRPMTLAPAPTPAGGSTNRHASGIVSNAAFASGLQGSPPTISITAGNLPDGTSLNGGGTGTNNTIPMPKGDFVPIGTYYACTVSAPGGLTLATETWAGLGQVGSYPNMGNGLDQPPPSNTAPSPSIKSIPAPVTQNVSKTNFLVVQPNTTYTIKVTVTYQNVANPPGQNGWISSVTFTSGPNPTYTYLGKARQIAGPDGTMENVPSPEPNVSANRNYIEFTSSPNILDGMGIEAQTSPSWPGNYMLMQTCQMLRQYTDGANTFNLANSFNTPPQDLQAFDNSTGGKQNTLGMEVATVTNPGQTLGNGWTQSAAPSPSQDVVAFDPVIQGVPVPAQGLPNPIKASVGGLNGQGGNETYTTYLMYAPAGNFTKEWVAIGQVTWGWGGTATIANIAGNNIFQAPIQNPSVSPVVPTALTATLPLWDITTSAIVAAGWQKVGP